MEETDSEHFEAQYPAEKYTSRPNSTAILSPLYDSTFKTIFTQETEESNFALKCFISAALNRKIQTVTVKNNEPPKETTTQKSMTYDIIVEFDNGELADIELQSHNNDYDFGTRAEIQAARLLTNSAKRGNGWDSEKIYQISILNFKYKNNDNKEVRWYNMTDKFGGKLGERLNVIFIDLVTIRKLCNKKTDNEFSPVEKWGLFFSYVDHDDKRNLIKNIADTEDGIMAAEKILEEMSKADDNWFIQNSIWIAQRDEQARFLSVKRKGLAEGRAQGLAEGKAQGLAEGRTQGRAEGQQQKAIENAIMLVKKYKATPEAAAQDAGAPLDKVLEALKLN